jgi:hypothetical protein
MYKLLFLLSMLFASTLFGQIQYIDTTAAGVETKEYVSTKDGKYLPVTIKDASITIDSVIVSPSVSDDSSHTNLLVMIARLDSLITVVNDTTLLVSDDSTHTDMNEINALLDSVITVLNDTTMAVLETNSGAIKTAVEAIRAIVDSTKYNEDAAHVTGDDGVFVLGVRNDGGASLVGTDGDYAPFSLNAYGLLNINYDMIRDVAPDVNAGVLSAGTPRVTIATDDSLVTVSQASRVNLDSLAVTVVDHQVQVDIVAELPAGTQNIGNVDVVSTVNATGNSVDSSYAVSASGTATAFPNITCKTFTITNFTVGEILYIGSSDNVTTSTGQPFWYGDSYTKTVANCNQLYYISDGTAIDIRCDIEN